MRILNKEQCNYVKDIWSKGKQKKNELHLIILHRKKREQQHKKEKN